MLLAASVAAAQRTSKVARQMMGQGMVNVWLVDKSIKVSLMYARAETKKYHKVIR